MATGRPVINTLEIMGLVIILGCNSNREKMGSPDSDDGPAFPKFEAPLAPTPGCWNLTSTPDNR